MSNQQRVVNWCHSCQKTVPLRVVICKDCHSRPERICASQPMSNMPGPRIGSQSYFKDEKRELHERLRQIQLVENQLNLRQRQQGRGLDVSTAFPGIKRAEESGSSGNPKKKRKTADEKPKDAVRDGQVSGSRPAHSLERLKSQSYNPKPSPAGNLAQGAKDAVILAPPKVRLVGNFDFTVIDLDVTSWCYDHSHGVPGVCDSKKTNHYKPVPYGRQLLIPIVLPADYTPIARDNEPKTLWHALQELTHFALSMFNYSKHVQRRDIVQQGIMRSVEEVKDTSDWSGQVYADLKVFCPDLNIQTMQFYQNIQRLTRQCYTMYCKRLLKEAQSHNLCTELFISSNIDSCAQAIAVAVPLRERRVLAKQTADPSIEPRDRGLWTEYVHHITNECDAFTKTILGYRDKFSNVRQYLEMSEVAPLLTVLTTGGFGCEDLKDRKTALPRLLYSDIDQAEAQVNQNYTKEVDEAAEDDEARAKAVAKARFEKQEAARMRREAEQEKAEEAAKNKSLAERLAKQEKQIHDLLAKHQAESAAAMADLDSSMGLFLENMFDEDETHLKLTDPAPITRRTRRSPSVIEALSGDESVEEPVDNE